MKQLGWFGIFRLGLVQASLGAIVVMTTSTLNRIMVVELALPAILPGALVTLHYLVQLGRPRLGYGSDVGGRRTPWIIGGMAVLALGGVGAAASVALMHTNLELGVALATVSFVLIGLGVGAAGTAMLVLMATSVNLARRPAAATVTWITMIFGFVLTSAIAGQFLDPYSGPRLVMVTAWVSLIAFVVTVVAVHGVEQAGARVADPGRVVERAAAPFRVALREVWQELESRRLAVFVFISMIAYSAQDLILEPFAGAVFGFSPGASTRLSGVQNGGVLLGMLAVAFLATAGRGRFGSMRAWTMGGCFASALALLSLAIGANFAPHWPLRESVFVLGLANGIYAVAAIGSMMGLVDAGRAGREGVRMGLWGAAQSLAFALGGLGGTAATDVARWLLGSPASAYASVFAIEAVLFVLAGVLAMGLTYRRAEPGTFGIGPRGVAAPTGR
jgi:BCD family chlorophyll transporter-like MFS transporter